MTRIAGALANWSRQQVIDSLLRARQTLGLDSSYRDSLKMCLALDADTNVTASLAPGYRLCVLRDVEEPSYLTIEKWVMVLRAAGFKEVNAGTFLNEYVEHPLLGVHFVHHYNSIVGVAGLRCVRSNEQKACVLNWVGVVPEHRGKGLAYAMTLESIRAARLSGRSVICLATDDFRLNAIRTYLRSGFRPCLASWDRTHHYRWKAISNSLEKRFLSCRDPAHQSLMYSLGE